MVDFLNWHIVLRPGGGGVGSDVPPRILTIAPQLRHESMPEEVALLLPANGGPKQLVDAIEEDPRRCRDAMLGLFLADPFLNPSVEGARLAGAGIHWIANLPSLAQQDPDFSQQSADVGLDHCRELECLSRFRGLGFKTAAVVADGPGALAAASIGADILFVLPRIADFAAGFPSLRQRGAAAQAVSEAARGAGWKGLLLGLAERREADHAALWPDRLDGLVCRPVPA